MVKTKNTIGMLSLLFLVFIIMFKSLVPTILGSWNNVYVCFGIIIALLLVRKFFFYKTVKIGANLFTLFIFVTSIIMLYKNNAFQNNNYNYLVVIFFASILLVFLQNDKIKVSAFEKIALLICILSVVFSIITWICYFSPSFYYNNIMPLFSQSLQETLLVNYKYYDMLAGLTDHYSRNAYYIMLGFIILTLNFKRFKNKFFIFGIIAFLGVTLGLVGKRGHIIFCLISLVITLFIQSKKTIKSFLKNNFKIIIFLIIALTLLMFIPGASNILDRIFIEDGQDFTSGRMSLYYMALNLANKTHFLGAGWGSFSALVNNQYSGVHNDYLQLLCEVGILGMLLFIAFHCFCLYKGIKFYKKHVDDNKISSIMLFSITFQMFFMLYSLSGIPHYDVEVYAMYLLSASIPWIISLKRNDTYGRII